MTAFDTMIDDLFADQNMAADAVYTPAGGSAVTVRILQAAPIEAIGGFEVKAVASKLQVQIRISQASDLAEGDQLVVAAVQPWLPAGTYKIMAPEADDDRLCWTASLRKVA